MSLKTALRYAPLICLILLVLSACNRQPSTRILFIGNSFTFFNGGLDNHLKGLATSSETESIAIGGYSLEKHFAEGNAINKIRDGKWNYVVLQEQSQIPVVDRNKFYEAVRHFDEEIRRSGAKTVLLMTWERPDSLVYGVTTKGLADAYSTIGTEIGAIIAPAGLAFANSLNKKPDLGLYSQDGHPTYSGTYLAACTLYKAIFGISPVGNRYKGGVTFTDWRTYLQQIAADTNGY